MQKHKPNKYYVAVHILAWMLIAILPFVFPGRNSMLKYDFIVTWGVSLTLSIGVFYIYYGFVFKRYLKQDALLKFVFISLSVLAGYIGFELVFGYLAHQTIGFIEHNGYRDIIIRKIFSNTFIIGVALFVSMVENWLRAQKYQQAIERERLESELKMLKFQVNPHFLFNTLNNIHTLVYKKSERAPEAILKLSSLMRYMLYETDGNRVSLAKELEYLQTFVELQKLRLAGNQQVAFIIEGDPNGYEIAPLLLVSFIENAFKHGARASQDTLIEIVITIANGMLTFCCTNDFWDNSQSEVNSGIGQANVKKRLELMYRGGYQLSVNTANDKYSVNLTLSL
jgi:sensor histidine kinase YesM